MDEKKRILIVDDESEILEFLQFEFESEGFEVFVASNGKEAFDLLQDTPVSFVVSDVYMPVWDGVRLIKEAKSLLKDKTPKFFFITGVATDKVKELEELGACGVLTKPFSYQTLIRNIFGQMEVEN